MDMSQYLKSMAKKAVLAEKTHAFLFYGMDPTSTALVCDSAVKALICPNSVQGISCNECSACRKADLGLEPRVIRFDPSEKNVTKEDTDQLRSSLYIGTGLDMNRICIINNCHTLSQKTANAILKILEEPPRGVRFFLTAGNISSVLPTVVSRCIPQHIPEPGLKHISDFLGKFIPYESARIISWRFRGLAGLVLTFFESGADIKGCLENFLFFLSSFSFNDTDSFNNTECSGNNIADSAIRDKHKYRQLISFISKIPDLAREKRDFNCKENIEKSEFLYLTLLLGEAGFMTAFFFISLNPARAAYMGAFISSALESIASEWACFSFLGSRDSEFEIDDHKRITEVKVSGEKYKPLAMEIKNQKLRLIRIYISSISRAFRHSAFIDFPDLNFDLQCDKINKFQMINNKYGFAGCTMAVNIIEEFQAGLNQSTNIELCLEALLSRLAGLAENG
jgi:hypothetical protein